MTETSVKEYQIRGSVLFIASLSSFLTPFMGSAVMIALPSIAESFSLDAIMINWVATSYLISSALFLLPMGRVADIWGRKKIFTWGTALFTAASLFLAFCPNAWSFLLMRVFQGIGSSMIFGTGVALLTSVYPPQERGRVLGINVAAVYLGLSLGPFVGGMLTHHLGWQSIFLIQVPFGLMVLYLVTQKIRMEWAQEHREPLDLPGALLYTAGLVSLMYGFSMATDFLGMLFIGVGVAILAAFVRWEALAQSPILDIRLFTRNRVFAFSNAAALIHYSATFSVSFLLSLYLQYVQGMSPQASGLILIIQPAIMTVLSPCAGRLSDRLEPRVLASAGMFITAAGLFLLAFLKVSSGLASIVPGLVLIGVGFALFSSPNTNAIMSSVDQRIYGTASGILATMRVLGQMTSMGITLVLFSIFIGRENISPVNLDGFLMSVRTGFMLCAFLCMIGLFASLKRGGVHKNPGKEGCTGA
ncbi:MAG TPA: MFS transporter [Deltaproteobacteria bacterium]|nr:MFS transporter [Deltaproteobacteria bacterium]